MPDLHIQRDHELGLDGARALAQAWADDAARSWGMACEHSAGDACDIIRFSRAGVAGTLEVSATRFELRARLGFLLGAFSEKIEQRLRDNLEKAISA
jgi:putative polyhydroxyalkanoate system protein